MMALRRDAPRQRMAVLAVGGDDRVVRRERLHHADRDSLLADVQVQEAADLRRGVELGALLLEAADAQHLAAAGAARGRVRRRQGTAGAGAVGGEALMPSALLQGREIALRQPSSRAFSSRRMILPLRVFGTLSMKSISFGATTAPSRLRRKAEQLQPQLLARLRSPACSATKALTISPTTGSGLPMTPASATAGCSISALSTSKGPTRWPAVLMTSSARPTNQ